MTGLDIRTYVAQVFILFSGQPEYALKVPRDHLCCFLLSIIKQIVSQKSDTGTCFNA